MDPLECGEFVPRSLIALRLGEIEFHDFISSDGACVLYVSLHRYRSARLRGRCNFQVAVSERGVAQSVAEAVEWLAVEIFVSAVLHGVVLKWRHLLQGRIERKRQSSGGIVVASQ